MEKKLIKSSIIFNLILVLSKFIYIYATKTSYN